MTKKEERITEGYKHWIKIAAKLVGKTITGVRLMSSAESEDHEWSARPFIFMLDDGSEFYPTIDDEANNGGNIIWSGFNDNYPPDLHLKHNTIPVFSSEDTITGVDTLVGKRDATAKRMTLSEKRSEEMERNYG